MTSHARRVRPARKTIKRAGRQSLWEVIWNPGLLPTDCV